MFRILTVAVLCAMLTGSNSGKPGPRHPASQGEIWPRPMGEVKTGVVFGINPAAFKYTITGKDCPKVRLAIQRCKDYITTLDKITKLNEHNSEYFTVENVDMLQELQIDLTQDCEDHPYYNMDESYNLTVASTATLKSASIWGIIRGMESFTQLFYLTSDYKSVHINGTQITDCPNYPHRGLLLDTSRHFISAASILKTLDAMAMNKMNLLHWHIVDDESFPYQSSKFPELSKAAYHPLATYPKKTIADIIEYASNLGIRVLVEVDMPGHVYSWGVSHPELLTDCDYSGDYSPPLNPIKKTTYSFVKELLEEVQELFVDDHFHLGGDEVQFDCWMNNQDIIKYMYNHNMTNIRYIYALFYKNVLPLLKKGTTPVFWQEVFDYKVPLPANAIVQVWKNADVVIEVLKANLRSIVSYPYYLDAMGTNFDNYYKQEPRIPVKNKLNNETLLENLIGGTACMWGEMVDDTVVLSRVWPRASAVAEVLWSETSGEDPDSATYARIEEHTCRMRRRGVVAEPPAGPGFCLSV